MGDCVTPDQVSEIASKDTNRIVGSIAKVLSANSPYINVLRGGLFRSGISDEVRSVVQMPAAPGDSLAEPTFTNDTEICGTNGEQDLTDTLDFSYRLQSKRGRGLRVCVKNGYSAFKDSYTRSEEALAKLVTQYVNADIRAQLTNKSASKFVAVAGQGFYENFEGGDEADIGIQFPNVLPTSAITFKTIHKIARFLKEALYADMFPAGQDVQPHFRLIGESDVIEGFRNELDVKEVYLAMAQGGFSKGEKGLTSFSFEHTPAYRGIAFGVDHTALRATGFNQDGSLAYVNPRINVPDPTKNTSYSKVNPAWLTAPYGVLHLIADNSFERQVPERYVGEGSFKFAPQLHMGELSWHYQIDNDCNQFGDFGWHKYQITRAYRPLRPNFVVSVLYKRCVEDLGLESCEAESQLDSSSSL